MIRRVVHKAFTPSQLLQAVTGDPMACFAWQPEFLLEASGDQSGVIWARLLPEPSSC
jgi:hypothetical protein